MTDTTTDISAFEKQIQSMAAAVHAKDLDAILDHFDDDCVFVNGVTGTVSPKSGLGDYMNETWQVFPDFCPRLVAAHIQDNVMGGLIENTATAPGPDGSVAAGGPKIQWLSTAFYTFDPDTLKVVREVYYADESVIEQKINAAQA